MREHNVVILEDDMEYLGNFLSYFENYNESVLRIAGFSEKDSFFKFINQNNIDLILTKEELLSDIEKDVDNKKILLLTEEDGIESINGIKTLYRFQHMKNIIRYIFNLCAESIPVKRDIIRVKGGEKIQIIGVYSPVKRCGKTALSIELAGSLAKNGKILLINMEEYSALRKDDGENNEYDLADLLYFYMQNSWSFELKLKAVLQNMCGFDYIPPMKNGSELRNITVEQWKGLISEIGKVSDYKIIILDVSDIIGNILQLLDMCDFVIMPYMMDEISVYKAAEFEKYLKNNEVKIYRIPMNDVINERYDKECLQMKVHMFMEERGLLILNG
ncbi:MAG: hypothetical protein HFI34_07080 [Lachnospiraceae bacterium]|nr:hypothetical protein [Lachnospiraceae bacterium]